MAQIDLTLTVEVPTEAEIKAAFQKWAAGKTYVNQHLLTTEFVPILNAMIKVSYR